MIAKTDLKRAAFVLKEILGMKNEPIGVKFFIKDRPHDGFGWPSGGEFCEMLMRARSGEKTYLRFKAACAVVAWVLRVRVPPDKLTLRWETGAPRSIYRAVAVFPLADAPFKPDVVIIDAIPEQLMQITLVPAPECQIVPAIIGDTEIQCLPVAEIWNACMKCHLKPDHAQGECLLCFPVKDLDKIVRSLEKLKQ